MAAGGDSTADLVTAAVHEAWAAGGYHPSPPAVVGNRPAVRPVPLEPMLAWFGVARQEVPGLTRATAAVARPELQIACPELVGDDTPLAGLLAVSAGGALVLVRRDDPVGRRRFSAAHELGHLLLHYRPAWIDGGDGTVDVVSDDTSETVGADAELPGLPERERQANQFAAELLMPEPVVRGLLAFYAERYGTTPRFIEGHVAGDLAVSRAAVRRRLAGLGL
jgi:hypothetical protein